MSQKRKLQKKIKKLIKNPGIFFRDYFNKRYPTINNEQKISEIDEPILIDSDIQMSLLEASIETQSTPVDVVFTWVNDRDDKWRQKYESALSQINSPIGLYANDQARFANHDELYYSVHSVLKFLPWVRKVFIVTDEQVPEWYQDNERYQKLEFISHHQIIDEQYLPTFNSHVIEANLFKIPDLSENFIYFNDDVFVARPLSREHFFASNDIASIFVAEKSLSSMRERGIGTPTLFAASNSSQLLQEQYGISIDMPLVHTYIPLKKSMFELAWQLFPEHITGFLPNKFRSNNDLNLATFLVPWLMYINAKSVFTREVCYYFNIRTNNALVQYKKLLSKKYDGQQPHSFCANDFNSQKNIPNYQQHLESMLQKYYDLS